MITAALFFAIGCFTLALLMNLYVVVNGPHVADRILALDTMVINVIALVVLYGIYKGSPIYFEVSLLIAMVGFVSTVAYCRFVLRGALLG